MVVCTVDAKNKVRESVPWYSSKAVVFILFFTAAFCIVLTKQPTPFTKMIRNG